MILSLWPIFFRRSTYKKVIFYLNKMHFQRYRLKSRILCLSDPWKVGVGYWCRILYLTVHHYLKYFFIKIKFCVTDGAIVRNAICWPSPVNVVQCQSVQTRILAISGSFGKMICKSGIIFSIRMEVVAAIRSKMQRNFHLGLNEVAANRYREVAAIRRFDCIHK